MDTVTQGRGSGRPGSVREKPGPQLSPCACQRLQSSDPAPPNLRLLRLSPTQCSLPSSPLSSSCDCGRIARRLRVGLLFVPVGAVLAEFSSCPKTHITSKKWNAVRSHASQSASFETRNLDLEGVTVWEHYLLRQIQICFPVIKINELSPA